MSRSAALLLAFAAVALSVASARLSPDDVSASEALTGRQLLGNNCKEKDGCQWCEDVGGKMEHGNGYECQPSTYILGAVTETLGGILGGHGSKDNKWCRAKKPEEPSCNKGWFWSDKSVSDCKCSKKKSGYCCQAPPQLPDCSTGMEGHHDWKPYFKQEPGCTCTGKGEGFCCYKPEPQLPDCSTGMEGHHDWKPYFEPKENCECVKKEPGYCCHVKEAPQPPPTCEKAFGSEWSYNKHSKRSGCSCKKAPGHGYCCKKVTPPKPRCVSRWWYGKDRKFCEDSKPDKTKFCIFYKFGGDNVRCCAKKEKKDYDDDRCFFKSVHNKMRKCCYDASRKMKKDKKHHSCITSSYNGKHGNFCYDKNAVY